MPTWAQCSRIALAPVRFRATAGCVMALLTMTLPHDLHSIFGADQIAEIRLELRVLGNLAHDGTIVARDPLAGSSEPFAERFPAGCHRVEVLVAHARGDERVALARVVFRDVVPQTFELALRGDEDARMLAPGQIFGYGVDAGTGCFATPEALESDEAGELLDELQRHARLTWNWAAICPRDAGHELVAFSTGYGDGIYASYVGRADDGSPVCLVTHFIYFDLQLPAIVDDAEFRRSHATASYERMKAAVPLLGTSRHGEAYAAAADLAGSPRDTDHLASRLIRDLLDARDELTRDLHLFVVKRLLEAPAVQRELAAHVATLDDAMLERLRVMPRALDPALFGAVGALWSRGDASLRTWWLEMGTHAQQLAPDETARLLERATEALDDGALQAVALGVLDHGVAHGHALSSTTLARVRTLGRTATDPHTKRRAFCLLVRSGVDVLDDLADPDPLTRLAAAGALGRDHAEVVQRVRLAIATDASLPGTLRHDAMHGVHDEAVKIAVALELALAGDADAAAALRWISSIDAITALERLVRESESPEVRASARRALESRRDIERMKHDRDRA